MDIDRKLSVLQEMRREQMKIERENYYPPYRRGAEGSKSEFVKEEHWFSSFRLRLLIAILLFFSFFLMEQKEVKIGEVGTVEMVKYIEENISLSDVHKLFDK